MSQPSVKSQVLIAAALAVFLLATRSPQFAVPDLLHSGSWAVFFLAGVYLTPLSALPALLVFAFGVDAAAFGWAGVSEYCLTPAYATLIPAYGCLWAAGRGYAGVHRLTWRALPALIASLSVGALACEAFASGGFYWLSGRFADPAIGEFLVREARYFPAYVATLYFWVALAAVVHIGIATARGAAPDNAV